MSAYPPPTSPPAQAQYFPPPPQQQSYYPPPPSSSTPPTSNSNHPSALQQQEQPQQHFDPPPSNAQTFAPPPVSTPPEKALSIHGGLPQAETSNQSMAAAAPTYATPAPEGMPSQANFTGAGTGADSVGTFNGGSFRVSHRDTNTVLTVQLAMGCPLTVKPGAMIAMSPTVTLKGSIKPSLKKLFIGGEMAFSTFTGPGEILFAPASLGDITCIRLPGNETWSVGKD
ncbi:hypothetical protein LTR66_009157, partial [Elasticomyces elasticus]